MLQVFDHKRLTRDSFLGQVLLDLTMLPPEHNSIHTATDVSFPLRKRTTRSRVDGNITLRIGFDIPAPTATPVSGPVSEPAARVLRASLSDELDETIELPANIQRTVDRNGREVYTNTATRQV
jgi:hypothetical protein